MSTVSNLADVHIYAMLYSTRARGIDVYTYEGDKEQYLKETKGKYEISIPLGRRLFTNSATVT